jgi:hypothetical protein
MAQMYVANCTNQTQDFMYRLPENRKIIKQSIPIGEQRKLSGDFSVHDVEAVVEQHGKYGMVAVSEIDRTKPFIGLCYSLDKRVDMHKVQHAVEHNYGVLEERGRLIRQEAAVATLASIEGADEGSGIGALEASIEEVPAKKDGSDTKVNEVIRVTRNEGPTRTEGAARARKARAGRKSG